ncbi:hypothetical protein E5Q_02376 [Mixia osmundae IAM 14324]|uniref:Uncharacterized protein n=1 Tax=Mixia osmundae (strain CBS 9802 / IAM 14324 / JCM 22182 / KY 12970) TaxID=764103 RepID=G7DYQ9_MIXOS|nr:hypothetical protein E5Q_02376 [Mixia osmundae IAM 14324]
MLPRCCSHQSKYAIASKRFSSNVITADLRVATDEGFRALSARFG